MSDRAAPATVAGRGAILRSAREAKGLTLRSAGDRLGIDFTYLSKIENGHDRPGADLVRRMGALYGQSFEDLLIEAYIERIPTAILQRIKAGASQQAREAVAALSHRLVQVDIYLANDDLASAHAEIEAHFAQQPAPGASEP